jgi:hypothetical protein
MQECHRPSPRRPSPAVSSHCRAMLVTIALMAGGCTTLVEPGRTERLPEGTLPPSREVGPPVNIQPAPRARDGWHTSPRRPLAYGPGWYEPRCFDPLLCGNWGGGPMLHGPRMRPGFGWHYRMF